MLKIVFDSIYADYSSKEELAAILTTSEEVSINVRMLDFARSSEDYCQDYLQVSFISEGIARFSTIRRSSISYSVPTSFIIDFVVNDSRQLAEFLFSFSCGISGEDNENGNDLIWALGEIEEYQQALNDRSFEFPELVDKYYANLVNGQYLDGTDEFDGDEDESYNDRDSIYGKSPEYRYGYWRSAASKKLGIEFYVSTEAWIIPDVSNLNKVLECYSGIDQEIILDTALVYVFKGRSVLYNKHLAIWFEFPAAYDTARAWAYNALKFKNDSNSGTTFLLSTYGDVFVATEGSFACVFFIDKVKCRHGELISIYEDVRINHDSFSFLLGLSNTIELDWDKFGADRFEELCYDIIYHHAKFDNKTIRKMGKTKSRDGGRDIVVMTKETIANEPQLFIFQCKFMKRSESLTRARLSDAANVIMQYGAKGYGIFTTGVIDAALYDMLDGFAQHQQISTKENWSIFEIERYLFYNTEMRKRYFLI